MQPSLKEYLSGKKFILHTHHIVLGHFSRVRLFATSWTVARQALSTGFSRQEYWSGLPHPPPEDLPDPDTELVARMSPALAGWFFTASVTWEAQSVSHSIVSESL